MTYPSTLESVLEERIASIRRGAERLATGVEARSPEPEQHRQYRLAASAGAQAYADRLNAGPRRLPHDLECAELVAKAAHCAGWLSATGLAGDGPGRKAMADLVDTGVFAYFEAVPGQWVACYRLMAPC